MQWTSCCRDKRRNCPSIAVEAGFLLIRDDDGAVVRVKLESAQDLILTIQETLPNHRGNQAATPCATT